MPGNKRTSSKKSPGTNASRVSLSKRGFLKLAGSAACAACAARLGMDYLPAHARSEEPKTKASEDTAAQPSEVSSRDSNGARGAVKGLLGPKRSPFYTALDDKKVRCELCPNSCTVSAGERGTCRVRENRDGALYSLVHGNPALLQIDPIERKPFFHVLPGTRSLSVTTAGCNMACKFCQVWDMALVDPEEVYAYDFPPSRVVSQARENDLKSVAYTLGEPVVFFEYMLDIATLAREAGIKNLLHSNGYINPEPLSRLAPLLDGVNIDLKSFDPSFYKRICEGRLEPVKQSLTSLKEAGVHIEITCILIPTLNDNPKQIEKMARWIRSEIGASTPLHFVRFYPLYKLANLPPTPISTLNAARDAAKEAGLPYVYVSNAPGHPGENTFCPGCEEMVIRRMGFMVEFVKIDEGKCENCNHSIEGVWTG